MDHRNCLQRRPPAADWRHARGLRAGQRRRMSTRAAIRWVRDPHLRRRHRCASRGASSALVSIGSRCAVKGLCRTAVGLILFCFFLTAWPRLAAAQAGEITGVVVDATGGVLPGATVTLSGGPDIPREVQADARGRFTFTDLSPGAYAVTVSLGGVGAVTVDGIVIAARAGRAAGNHSARRLRRGGGGDGNPPRGAAATGADEHLGGERYQHRAAGQSGTSLSCRAGRPA